MKSLHHSLGRSEKRRASPRPLVGTANLQNRAGSRLSSFVFGLSVTQRDSNIANAMESRNPPSRAEHLFLPTRDKINSTKSPSN